MSLIRSVCNDMPTMRSPGAAEWPGQERLRGAPVRE